MRSYLSFPILLLVGCAVDAEPGDDPTTTENTLNELEACETLGQTEACVTVSGTAGARRCEARAEFNYEPFFGVCGDTSTCSPGDTASCGFEEVDYLAGLTKSCVQLEDGSWGYDPYACNTPLVLNFSEAPVEFTQAKGYFDLMGGGASVSHDWVSAKTPWLALDRNRNGSIDDGRELFGSMTRLASGQRAEHGFMALAEFDANEDARIDAADPDFSRLLLWRDQNQDRRASSEELSTLAADGVSSLALDYTRVPRCTLTSCEVERANFGFTDAAGRPHTGTTIDVHFRSY